MCQRGDVRGITERIVYCCCVNLCKGSHRTHIAVFNAWFFPLYLFPPYGKQGLYRNTCRKGKAQRRHAQTAWWYMASCTGILCVSTAVCWYVCRRKHAISRYVATWRKHNLRVGGHLMLSLQRRRVTSSNEGRRMTIAAASVYQP